MQTVNFYFSEYRPKPLTFDSRFAALALLVSAIMFVVIGVIKSNHINEQLALIETKQTSLTELQQAVQVLQSKMQIRQAGDDIDNRISRLAESLKDLQKVLTNMQQIDSEQQIAYSEILQQLSEQDAKNLWLTKINIVADSLSLEGSATRSEAIPEYVDLLKQAQALKRQFDQLNVERDTDDIRIVHFSLLNGRLNDSE